MEPYLPENIRHQIINNYARWCAFSSTRSGCPIKKREAVYPLIDLPDYSIILKGVEPIAKDEFNEWHEKNSQLLNDSCSEICIGWCTKLINVYLKTIVYVGSLGRPGLSDCIHPPIDGGLWQGIKEKYKERSEIISLTHCVSKIKDITHYKIYKQLIVGMELVAKAEKSSLLEVEKLWKGTEI